MVGFGAAIFCQPAVDDEDDDGAPASAEQVAQQEEQDMTINRNKAITRALIATSAFCLIFGAIAPQAEARKAGKDQQDFAFSKPTPRGGAGSEVKLAEPPDTIPVLAEPPETMSPRTAEPPDEQNGDGKADLVVETEDKLYDMLDRNAVADLNQVNSDRGLSFKDDLKIWQTDSKDGDGRADLVAGLYDDMLNRAASADMQAAMQTSKNLNLNFNLPTTRPGLVVAPQPLVPFLERPTTPVQVQQVVPVVSPTTQRSQVPVVQLAR